METELDFGSPGGVADPYVEFNVEDDFVAGTEEPLLPLLESVDPSVLKLDLERLRNSFKNERTMTTQCVKRRVRFQSQ